MPNDAHDAALVGIASAVRAARAASGWSQRELADQAGLSRPTIARIESGQDASTASLAKVARALGLSLTIQQPAAGP